MARKVSNVNILTDTWEIHLLQTNEVLSALSNEIITANASYGVTGNTDIPRNSQLVGSFGANNIVVTDTIRGGNVAGGFTNLVAVTNVFVTNTTSSNVHLAVGNTTSLSYINPVSVNLGNTGANAYLTTNTMLIQANSSANLSATVNTVLIQANSSANAYISATNFQIANSSKITFQTASGYYAGNTAANASLTDSALSITSNSTVSTTATATNVKIVSGVANLTGTATSIVMNGNTTTNSSYSATRLDIVDGTSNTVVTSNRIATGNTTANVSANSTVLEVANAGSNSTITPSSIKTGNTTAEMVITSNVISTSTPLRVANATTFSNTVLVVGNTTLSNTLAVTGATTLANTLDVTGATTMANTLRVTGAANLISTLGVGGAANLFSTLGVVGATSLANTLDVTGATTMANTLRVTGAANLLSTVGVAGSANLFSTLGVVGATSLANTLAVTGATTMANTLSVTGAANLISTVGVGGAANLFSTLGVVGATTLSNTLTVTGLTTLNGNMNTPVANASTEVNVGPNVKLNTTSLTIGNSTVNSAITSTSVDLDGTLAVLNSVSFSNTLAVTGATTIANTLGVTGAANVGSTLGVVGATTLSSTLGVTGAANLASTLGVVGAVSLSNTLGVAGATTLSSTLGVTGAANLASTLGVVGAVAMSNTLAVTGAATFSNTISVTNTATLSNTLSVAGLATLSAGLNTTVANTASINTGNSTVYVTVTGTNIGGSGGNPNAQFNIANASIVDVAGSVLANSTQVVIRSAAGLSANGSLGSSGQVLKTTGSTVYWGPDINTTYNISTVANTTVNKGIIRLTDSSNVNTDIFIVGGTGANVASNSSQITITASIETSANYTFTGIHTHNANLAIGSGHALIANGQSGLAGYILSSNGTSVYWSPPATYTSPTATDGLGGNTTHYYVIAGNGILANTAGTHVRAGIGVTSNSTGVHIGQDVATTASPTFAGRLSLNFANTSVAGTPTLISYSAGNTFTVPTQTTTGAKLLVIQPQAYTGSAYTGGAKIEAIATESITDLARGTRWDFTAIAAGGAVGTTMSYDGNDLTLNGAPVATLAQSANLASNATYLTTGTIPYGRFPANIANTTGSFTISGAWTYNSNITLGQAANIIMNANSGIQANGTYGTSGQVLHSNGSAVYWGVDDNLGTVTSVASGNGISGGTITTTGTLFAVGANGISVTTSGINVTAGPGLASNSTGVHAVAGSGIASNSTGVHVVAGSGIASNSTGVHVVAGTALVSNSTGVHLGSLSSTGTYSSGISSITVDGQGRVTSVTGGAGYITTDTNTTYDLVSVANTAANAGRIRLSASTLANDDIIFVGTGGATVSSNSTQVTINSPSGTVTSVGGTGTVNGITLSGSVTSSGNLTLSGGITAANTSTAGIVQLVDSTSNTSVTHAATPKSVKSAYDLAATKISGITVQDDPITDATRYILWTDGTGSKTDFNMSSGGLGLYPGLLSFNSASGILTSTGVSVTVPVRETRVAMGSGSIIDLSSAAYFTKTLTGSTTFTVSGVPSSGNAITFILDLTNAGAYPITWWSGVKWPNGFAPALTASGRDMLGFTTYDGGTTWSGFVLGYDVK